MSSPDVAARPDKTAWFTDARFGMFIHWGPYAVYGRGEWVRSDEQMTFEDYEPAVAAFGGEDFDAREWARIAVDAGMKYAVLTAKHHDGYCMWDTAYTTYNSVHQPMGRDVVREYVDAFREAGLKAGLYYSTIDWRHPDYPAFGDEFHPDRENEAFRGREHNFDRYLDFMHAQVEELCANYGPLDILWFDFSYGEMTGEKWRATELIRMVRSYHPDILIDNRLETSGGGFGSVVTANPTEYAGDFVSPEQLIPPGGIRREDGSPVPWEANITTNNNWGFHAADDEFKSGSLITRQLVECVSKGGNFLVNIGPDARGNVPEGSSTALAEVGAWLRTNGESVYGAGPAALDRPEWGVYTQRGNNLYAHIFLPIIGPMPMTGGLTRNQLGTITRLADHAELGQCTDWLVDPYGDLPFIQQGEKPWGTYRQPDEVDTVIRIELQD